jgi:hypothetical protein
MLMLGAVDQDATSRIHLSKYNVDLKPSTFGNIYRVLASDKPDYSIIGEQVVYQRHCGKNQRNIDKSQFVESPTGNTKYS